MFATGSGQHYEETRHEGYDPTKFPSRNGPVIPIPPQPIPANVFAPMSNNTHNPNAISRHFSRAQPPHARNDSFREFTNATTTNGVFDPNTSPFFDSNSRLHDGAGPPVIPVPNGMGGFMLAAGVHPDGTPALGAGASHISSLMPPPPQFQQPQSMGMSMDGRQGQRFPQGPAASSSQPPAHAGPVQPPLSRPSWAQGSTGPPAWLMSSTTTATATSSQAQAQAQAQPPPQAPPTYSSPYVIPHLVQQGGAGGGGPQPSGSGQYYGPQPPVTSAPIHNTTEFTRDTLLAVLDRFSETLEDYFDMEPQSSSAWPSPPHGTPPHQTPPYPVATGSGGGDAEASGSGGEKRKPRPTTLRMAVHGGACMLLHQGLHSLSLDLPLAEPSHGHSDPHARGGGGGRPLHMSELTRRTTTRDVDIILRGFVADFGGLGPPPNPGERLRRNPTYPGEGQPNDPNPDAPTRVAHMDAPNRLKACIRNTTRYFPGLGLDWMNADPDVALPLGADPQTKQTFDPLHRSTFTSNNIKLFTVYTSPNKRLMLVSVPPYWSIALKIARWGQRDWADVGILLRAGTILSQTQWTEDTLMEWLKKNCWAMGYAIWEERKVNEMKERIRAAVGMIEGWEPGFSSHSSQAQRPPEREREPERAEQRGPPPGHSHSGMPVAVRENVRDWGSREEKKRSMSRPRTKSRSKSRGPPEIFIPPAEDGHDADYDGGYGYRDFEEPRGRPHHHRHHGGNMQAFAPPLVRGPSGALSQATAVAPFFHQPQVHSAGGHNQRPWRRQSTSRSRNRDNKKAKKAKMRDRQRRSDHQRRTEVRSEWTVPSDSESETESEDSEDDSDDDEGDKENRDSRRAWRQSHIYGPSKKRPPPLNLAPNAFPPPQPPPHNPFVQQHQPQQQQQQVDREPRQPFYSQPPQQQQGPSQRNVQSHWQQPPQPPPMFTQPHLQPQSQHRSSPLPPPPPPPINGDPATLAQYQFEQQMLSLHFEREREQQVRETMGRIAGRVMARGRV